MEERRTTKITPSNPWKIAFLSLVGVIVIALFIMVMLLLAPTKTPEVKPASKTSEQPLLVSVTPSQASKAVNYALSQQSDAKRTFQLKKESKLTGEITVLGKEVPYTLLLKPEVTKGGNLRFEATKVKAGRLRLPLTLVLSGINASHSLPDWIQVDAVNHVIDVYLTKLPLEDFQIKVKALNWEQNQVQLALYYKESEKQ